MRKESGERKEEWGKVGVVWGKEKESKRGGMPQKEKGREWKKGKSNCPHESIFKGRVNRYLITCKTSEYKKEFPAGVPKKAREEITIRGDFWTASPRFSVLQLLRKERRVAKRPNFKEEEGGGC